MKCKIKLSKVSVVLIVVAVILALTILWALQILPPGLLLNPGGPISELWDRTLGSRSVIPYPNGSIALKSLRRWQPGRGSLLVKGDYYDLEGRKRSTVRDGTGVAMLFTSNGVLTQMASYVNGIRCGPQIFWTKQGHLREYRYYDIQGWSHGIRYGFHENGEMRRKTLFNDYGHMLYDKYWHENGSLKSLVTYDKEGRRRQKEYYYDESGCVTQQWDAPLMTP